MLKYTRAVEGSKGYKTCPLFIRNMQLNEMIMLNSSLEYALQVLAWINNRLWKKSHTLTSPPASSLLASSEVLVRFPGWRRESSSLQGLLTASNSSKRILTSLATKTKVNILQVGLRLLKAIRKEKTSLLASYFFIVSITPWTTGIYFLGEKDVRCKTSLSKQCLH